MAGAAAPNQVTFIKLFLHGVCTQVVSIPLRPGAPPHRAGGEVTSASRCNCRSIVGGQTPGRGCPSRPAGWGGVHVGHVSEEGVEWMQGWVGSPSPCPSGAYLLKAGVPLLCCDHKLDPVAHIVLKLAGGRRKEAENHCPVS